MDDQYEWGPCSPARAMGFQHDGTNFTTNYIGRASPERISSLVNRVDPGPVLRKDGKPRRKQPPPYRDESGDFYAAQCAHYGLAVKKTRPANKRTLQAALRRSGTGGHAAAVLQVPATIIDLEERLRVQFLEANEAWQLKQQRDWEAARPQREAEEEAARARWGAWYARPADDEDDERPETDRAKDDSNRALAQVEAAMSKAGEKKLTVDAVAGSYRLYCPYIEEQWGGISESSPEGYTFSFAPLKGSGSALYGEFDLAVVEGYVKSTKVDLVGRSITFNWHGRETGEGESSFGEDDNFVLSFDSAGTVFRGTVVGSLFSKCEVFGVKESGAKCDPRACKREYDSLNEDNYEHERVSRWG